MSLSVRRAWIEIDTIAVQAANSSVALRKESVDRNIKSSNRWISYRTSLSVRRAWIEIEEQIEQETAPEVALRKESVDRNSKIRQNKNPLLMSLSVRRAWIEIFSVREVFANFEGSLSVRRAWIEILTLSICLTFPPVALRKESVDRNVDPDQDTLTDDGRSP